MNPFKKTFVCMFAALAFVLSGTATAQKPERSTIVDVASAVNAATVSEDDPDGEFAILIAVAMGYPDILDYLAGKGQRTLFAPTDAAFASLETLVTTAFCFDSLGQLVEEQPDYIADVLLYHVTKGRKDSTEVLPKDRIRMLTGDFVTRVPNTTVITDVLGRDANIEMVDVEADNGIIHVISEVILPYAPASACPETL